MKSTELKQALNTAVEAARSAGALMRKNLRSTKIAHLVAQHDIKLELDVRCQKVIEKILRAAFPEIALLGEEGVAGDSAAPCRWVVDPIDGTVNFAYTIPHACVSIALQEYQAGMPGEDRERKYRTLAGVVYDPFVEELWTAIRGQPARLNGKVIRVSRRSKLAETVISLGFAKYDEGLQKMLPRFQELARKVRKIRVMGSAALDLVYVASGRFDGYVECGVRLWDVAAGGLILECAGGEFWNQPLPGEHNYYIVANNGRLRKLLTGEGETK